MLRLISLLITCCLTISAGARLPEPTPEDRANLPDNPATLFWKGEQKIAGFRNMVNLTPARLIEASGEASDLPRSTRDLNGVTLPNSMTVDEYFEQQKVAGLLVIKDGEIVYERYGLGNDEDSLWVSFSVAKSVVAMLYGAAVKDGYIKDLDAPVTDYLPHLKNSSYDESSIRNILQMSSGVEWNEDYADPNSDVATASWETIELYEFLRNKPRETKPGDKFNYNTAETNLAGTLLRSAIGNNLATYLSDKIWKPAGMEADAYWQLTEPGGGEFGGCCINATLRDYGRIGLFAMSGGVLPDGSSPFTPGWMDESTAPSKAFDGYGYFWWLNPDDTYQATGIFGQGIYINKAKNVVIAIHSAREDASKGEDWELQGALYTALANAVSD